jgi:hypothetical protein
LDELVIEGLVVVEDVHVHRSTRRPR